jgi:hypothetical protein
MFGIERMGLPVGQSAECIGEVGKFALGSARAAPVGMLLAGLFDKAVFPWQAVGNILESLVA